MNEDGTLLELDAVDTYYGQIHILQGLSLRVGAGELVCLLGGNASGKSTTLKTIIGIVRPRRGAVQFEGEEVSGRPPSYRIGKGMAIVPENRRLFAPMTVLENLQMGAVVNPDADIAADLARVFALFPRLAERRDQRGGTLSGGEQQMLAIARALMGRPRLLLLDEPSLGLAPLIAQQIFDIVRELNTRDKITVFLVEQNAFHALKLAHRGYVMVNGKITLTGSGAELLKRQEVQAAYLEGGRH